MTIDEKKLKEPTLGLDKTRQTPIRRLIELLARAVAEELKKAQRRN